MADLTETLAELDRLEREATPRPWKIGDEPPGSSVLCWIETDDDQLGTLHGGGTMADGNLIVELRNACRPLLDALAAQADELERLRADREELRGLAKRLYMMNRPMADEDAERRITDELAAERTTP